MLLYLIAVDTMLTLLQSQRQQPSAVLGMSQQHQSVLIDSLLYQSSSVVVRLTDVIFPCSDRVM